MLQQIRRMTEDRPPCAGIPVSPHSTRLGCCCRGCLQKWHGIPPGRPLSETDIQRIVDILMFWIRDHADGIEHLPHTPDLF